MKRIIDMDLAALQAAEGLENALLNQKGFVSYYFLDGDPDWLKKLGEYRRLFKERLKEVRQLARTATDMATIDQIEAQYAEYIKKKDRVISLYKAGEREVGFELHWKVRSHFFKILDLCENFDVISEEIRHIDNIVQNFLEFSRPPKLKPQKVSPSDVVDMALQLLRHRLESYDAHVKLNRQRRLPEIMADPKQLKEVLVNLLVNACEAVGTGARIVISEQEGFIEPLGRVVVDQAQFREACQISCPLS